MSAHKVLGNWLRQFTCPKCGQVGAGCPSYLPLCNDCNYEVRMLPSNNGRIVPNWQAEHQQDLQRMQQDKEQANDDDGN